MMLPGFIFLILFNFVPMFGAIMAFQDYRPAKGFFGSDFVGLKHFKYLFEMPDSFELFRNTLIIALGKIVLTTIMSIAFAILLNEVKNRIFGNFIQKVLLDDRFAQYRAKFPKKPLEDIDPTTYTCESYYAPQEPDSLTTPADSLGIALPGDSLQRGNASPEKQPEAKTETTASEGSGNHPQASHTAP